MIHLVFKPITDGFTFPFELNHEARAMPSLLGQRCVAVKVQDAGIRASGILSLLLQASLTWVVPQESSFVLSVSLQPSSLIHSTRWPSSSFLPSLPFPRLPCPLPSLFFHLSTSASSSSVRSQHSSVNDLPACGPHAPNRMVHDIHLLCELGVANLTRGYLCVFWVCRLDRQLMEMFWRYRTVIAHSDACCIY